MQVTLISSAFSHQGSVPQRYTCEGADISPPLAWTGAPAGTKSFVLVVDDPDAPDPRAPRMTWVHWVLYNLPAAAQALPEGVKGRGAAYGDEGRPKRLEANRIRRSLPAELAGTTIFTNCMRSTQIRRIWACHRGRTWNGPWPNTSWRRPS